jgi:hypothetical protein
MADHDVEMLVGLKVLILGRFEVTVPYNLTNILVDLERFKSRKKAPTGLIPIP